MEPLSPTSASSAAQTTHHTMRASARETYNPKSASLTGHQSSSTHQQIPKLQDKLKCVLIRASFSQDEIFSHVSGFEKSRLPCRRRPLPIREVRFESIRVNIVLLHRSSSKSPFALETDRPTDRFLSSMFDN